MFHDDQILVADPSLTNAGFYYIHGDKSEIYEYFPGILETQGVQASSLACNGNTPLTVNDAKYKCNNTTDCQGFFHYNSNGRARTCFKKNVNTANKTPMSNSLKNSYPNAGFYAFTGTK